MNATDYVGMLKERLSKVENEKAALELLIEAAQEAHPPASPRLVERRRRGGPKDALMPTHNGKPTLTIRVAKIYDNNKGVVLSTNDIVSKLKIGKNNARKRGAIQSAQGNLTRFGYLRRVGRGKYQRTDKAIVVAGATN